MKPAARKAAFVLAATDHGTLIVNRFDYHHRDDGVPIGVGFHLLESAACEPGQVGVEVAMLELARKLRGDGVVAVDCGANIGVHTVEWARAMTGWGEVLAFEAQERLYYALAGNLAINNCFNARAFHLAVAARNGAMRVPQADYQRPGSFGSLEMRPGANNEYIGQAIDYSDAATAEIATLSLDSLQLPRLDVLKIDVEAMELEVLEGASLTLARTRPMLVVECLKTDKDRLQTWLEAAGYQVYGMGANFVGVHRSDPARDLIRPGKE